MYPAPACRTRRAYGGGIQRLIAGAFIIILLLVLLSKVSVSVSGITSFFAGAGKDIPSRLTAVYQKKPLQVLKKAMPVLGWSSFESDAGSISFTRMLSNVIGAAVGVNLRTPSSLLQSQILLLKAVPLPEQNETGLQVHPVNTTPPAKALSLPEGECLVSIYNTHTGETYTLTDGVERLDGKRGGVVTAAAALQEALESNHKIKVIRSDKIHDLIYNTSYIESEKTARELLAANPGTMAILDIHRDSSKPREQSVVKVNGQEAAPILFIVGSDARRPFPNWRQNHSFALALSERMNELYPGLCLGVRVKDGVYNQSLHPGALLVEVGTSNNSTEEAVRSARMLADVLAGVLAEKTITEIPGEAMEE